MDFQSLPRRQLQILCKQHKIPANTTNVAMAAALRDLAEKGGCEIVIPDVTAPTPCKSALSTPVATPGRVTRSQVKQQRQRDEMVMERKELFVEERSSRRLPSKTAVQGNDEQVVIHSQASEVKVAAIGPLEETNAAGAEVVQLDLSDAQGATEGTGAKEELAAGIVLPRASGIPKEKKDICAEERIVLPDIPEEKKDICAEEGIALPDIVEEKKDTCAEEEGIVLADIPEEKTVTCAEVQQRENPPQPCDNHLNNGPQAVDASSFAGAELELVSSMDGDVAETEMSMSDDSLHHLLSHAPQGQLPTAEEVFQSDGSEEDKWCGPELLMDDMSLVGECQLNQDPAAVEQLSYALSTVTLEESSATSPKSKAKVDKENLPLGFERFSLRQLKKFQKELYGKKKMEKLSVTPLSPNVSKNNCAH
ncbi:uncharacterized protein LOC112340941 [Selaginella moellendorffii]|uniref:uncharacterized protein LOC112340941 n=1 Tax=Selaginella moellendorffii TaxID=88036 RepID=UPI000D1CD4B9|nr:uncharacterized protein LOC112340941 [Selaginella moellendorffii]|eukprot:XP_024515980.1 uncharacterized protein LOC112340941 [Selaginella moellendorffii]